MEPEDVTPRVVAVSDKTNIYVPRSPKEIYQTTQVLEISKSFYYSIKVLRIFLMFLTIPYTLFLVHCFIFGVETRTILV